MNTLYLECNMGAAGDMLTAALLELTDNPDEIVQKLNHLGLPGVSVRAVPSTKCGIVGTHMEVTVDGEEEGSQDVPLSHHDHHSESAASDGQQIPDVSSSSCTSSHADGHSHEHDSSSGHGAHQHHHHTHPEDVKRIISQMQLSDEVKQDILNVYHMIAEAEARAHRIPIDQIHFHEVGTLDAIMDVTAVCLLMHEIHPDMVIASPVCTGFGEVRCAHGILPVPAPATANLLTGIPTYSGTIEGEMCTPTGAALLKYYVKKFEERPEMTVRKIGYGMGNKDFPKANCVRAYLGDTVSDRSDRKAAPDTEAAKPADRPPKLPDGNADAQSGHDSIVELRCNIDDMTGEDIGYAVSHILAAGARDVFTAPINMKKNRPGILLTVICSPEDREKMVREIFRETTTIGIRETLCSRYVLNREEAVEHTAQGDVRIKTSSGYGVSRIKPEYDDIATIADKSGESPAEIRRNLAL